MSEYQYYEFQAIDRPLDKQAMAALRRITSRADITPTSLVNVYHFGDFKGDPARLMERYFDAFLYAANWGSRRFMLRMPEAIFDPAVAEPYLVPDVLDVWATKTHVIVDFTSEEEEGDWEEGEGLLASLVPLRGELLAGDLRCLYLGWLAGIESGHVDEDEEEPPVPPGLQDLSASLKAFADFVRLDPALIEVAAAASTGASPAGPSDDEFQAWIATLPESEKNRLLFQVMQGNALYLGNDLLRRFRQDQAPVRPAADEAAHEQQARRTVASLLSARDVRADEKRRLAAEKEAKKEARRAAERAAARAAHLDALAGSEEKLWQQIEEAIAAKQAKEYGRAVTILKDLRDLAARSGATESFARRVRELQDRNRRKETFIRRLDNAGLLK